MSADGTLDYVPNPGFSGNDVVGFAVTDADGYVSDFGAVVAVSLPCFASGTRIATSRGNVQVEELKVGDSILTHFTENAKVSWIGHRHVNCCRHPDPSKVWPVRIAVSAFGEHSPHRDLWLSPDHAVFVDDVLIPAKLLINGTTIAQVQVDDVSYYHIELERHDVLLAEGLPVESTSIPGTGRCSRMPTAR